MLDPTLVSNTVTRSRTFSLVVDSELVDHDALFWGGNMSLSLVHLHLMLLIPCRSPQLCTRLASSCNPFSLDPVFGCLVLYI